MSEKNGASPKIGAVLQKILALLDAIEQREQQQDVIEALSSGRRGAAADDGSSAARINASVDVPASDRGGPSPDPSCVALAASTATILVDSLGDPDPKNKNRKHFNSSQVHGLSLDRCLPAPGCAVFPHQGRREACQPAPRHLYV
jgi:hypothetical protein